MGILIVALIFSLMIERIRLKNGALIQRIFHRWLNPLLKISELDGPLTGATWSILGLLSAIIIFPPPIAIFAMLIMTLGDPIAAIAGQTFGRLRIFGKTIEGSLAGIAVCIVFGILFLKIPLAVLTAGAVGGMLVELLPLPLNDNLIIPIAAGFSMVTIGFFIA
ncbi:MAG: hypothetical protein HQ528_10565 [Candidatus Marinimicrobia bacterium]|nr:hypothetical protein [Candidatus Neomarinimicrobiota bacterium]